MLVMLQCEMLKLTVNPADPLVAELPENRRDPHDTCDVAARCKYLCFDKQHDLMINLSSAIRHWGFVCGMVVTFFTSYTWFTKQY